LDIAPSHPAGIQTTYVYHETGTLAGLTDEKMMAAPYDPSSGNADIYYNYQDELMGLSSWKVSYQIRSEQYPILEWDNPGTANDKYSLSYAFTYYSNGNVHFAYSYADQFWGYDPLDPSNPLYATLNNPDLVKSIEYYQGGGLKVVSDGYLPYNTGDYNDVDDRLTLQANLNDSSYATKVLTSGKVTGFTFTSAMVGEPADPFNQ